MSIENNLTFDEVVNQSQFLRSDQKTNLSEVQAYLSDPEKSQIKSFIETNEKNLNSEKQKLETQKTISDLQKIIQENPELLPHIDQKIKKIYQEINIYREMKNQKKTAQKLNDLDSEIESLFS